MTIVWGTNRFTDCVAILRWKDQTVLSVAVSPLRVTLKAPAGLPAKAELEVVDNRVTNDTGGSAKVTANPDAATILWKDVPILMVQQAGEDVHLHADLRPLGMNIFDDSSGLHVGPNILARSAFERCSAAIALG